MFTSMAREAGRPLTVGDVLPAAQQALAEVFDVAFAEPLVQSARDY
jgi:hypothetical protein